MAIIGSGPKPQPMRRDLTYAEFERTRGGLLYALQGALGTGVFVLLRQPNISTAAALAVVAAGHCLYFGLRWPLWRYLYRHRGHVESHSGLRYARRYLRISLGLTIALPAAMALRGDPVPLIPLTGAMLVAWAIMAVAGRLPVDAGMLSATGFFVVLLLHPDLDAAYINPDVWFYSAMGLAILGLRQHVEFSAAKDGPPPE